jgi:G protein-coupled receptor GPR1
MLLIFGSLLRSSWYLIFAAVSFAQRSMRTESPFCQASGFLIAMGTEMNGYVSLDASILEAEC